MPTTAVARSGSRRRLTDWSVSKPTRGRLAQDALMRQMPVRIVSDGVLTRSVRDTAAFYREAERIWRNPRLQPVGDVRRPLSGRLRVAVVTRGIGRVATADVREQTLRTASSWKNWATSSRRWNPRCRTRSPMTSSCTGRCWPRSWSPPGGVRARSQLEPEASISSRWVWRGTPDAMPTGCRRPSPGCGGANGSRRVTTRRTT